VGCLPTGDSELWALFPGSKLISFLITFVNFEAYRRMRKYKMFADGDLEGM
jgi:hypothetical protein